MFRFVDYAVQVLTGNKPGSVQVGVLGVIFNVQGVEKTKTKPAHSQTTVKGIQTEFCFVGTQQ